MIPPNEKPLTPASSATDGIQGADAETQGLYVAKDTLEAPAALILALIAADAACTQLARYALATDTPAWAVVEAADLLDAAREMLAYGYKP